MDRIEKTDLILYNSPTDGKVRGKVLVSDNDIWTSQGGMSKIFETTKQNISKHLKNIFSEGELDADSVVNKKLSTASDGKDYAIKMYSLDAIIAVGYRVNSYQATQFRIWATTVLKEYMTKGFVLDDDRLKQGSNLFDKDYFSELLERIREIRSSERRFYQKITDLYRDSSYDYDKNSPHTREFYQMVQNKLLFSVSGNTAAEIIKSRADADVPNMGLSTWKGQGQGKKIILTDITVAKNYLTEAEIKSLNRIVTMLLDYAENMVERNISMKMSDWIGTLDDFLKFNRYNPLENKGSVSKLTADKIAKKEYKKFKVIQDNNFISDFDNAVKKVSETNSIPSLGVKETKRKPLNEFDSKLKKALENNPKDKG